MSYNINSNDWTITNPLLTLSDTSYNFIKYLNGNWSSISCSNNTIAAVNSYILFNMIFLSTDSGNTWTNITGDVGSVNLSYVYISNNNILLSAIRHGYYLSNLNPINWNFNTNYSFTASVCSTNGTIISGVDNNIYVSTNGGTSFTEFNTGPNMICIGMNATGSLIIAGGGNQIYLSTNSGTSFSSQNFNNSSIVSISTDASGSNIVLGTTENISLSTDSGSTWSNIYTVNANDTLCCVYITSDGSVIYGATLNNSICYSSDAGTSWSFTYPNNKNQNNWSSITSNSNGSTVYACINGDHIYTVNATI
jgi:photosystem II stability/assembly factor-like uncharacterized protein